MVTVVGYDRSFDSLDDDRVDHIIALQGGGRLAWPMSWVVRPFTDLRLGALIYKEDFPDRWSSGFLATLGLGVEVSVHERVVLGAAGWLSYIPFVAQWGLTATWLLERRTG